MDSEPEIYKNSSDACGNLDATMPHARSNDDIALHRHTINTGRPDAGGYNRNLHTTPVQRASSASQTPTTKAGPSATSTPNPPTTANTSISQTAPKPVLKMQHRETSLKSKFQHHTTTTPPASPPWHHRLAPRTTRPRARAPRPPPPAQPRLHPRPTKHTRDQVDFVTANYIKACWTSSRARP